VKILHRILVAVCSIAVGLGAAVLAPNVGGPVESASASPSILGCEFSPNQVFDVQWFLSGSTLSASSFDYPFSNYGLYYPAPGATRLSAGTLAANDYFSFFASTTAPGTLGLELFDSAGTLKGIIDDTGSFVALGTGFIFYNGDGSWGTLFTTSQAYAYGDSANLTATNTAPTDSDALAYSNCSAAPLVLPTVSAGAPTSGVVGARYTPFTVPVVAGSPSFAVTTGALPPGLTIDPGSGVISGTPTAAGTYSFTLTLTGSSGSITVTYTIIVTAKPALASTGVDKTQLTDSFTAGAVAIVIGGSLMLLLRRRRRHWVTRG
jgi:hypothetical protein